MYLSIRNYNTSPETTTISLSLFFFFIIWAYKRACANVRLNLHEPIVIGATKAIVKL